jgi:hypothetical protein
MQRTRLIKVVATAAALAVGVVTAFAGPAGAVDQFDDVEGNEFYGPAVDWLFEQGLTTGYGGSDAQPSDVYEPHLTVDRAQMATFLWRMAGRPAGDPDHGFTDVDDDAYYGPAVAWLKESGVTTGVGGSDLAAGTTFEPHRSVTRGEAITFLWRYGGRPGAPPPPTYPPHGFTDTTPGAFYEPALNWAKAEGLTTGYGGSHANPTNIYVPDGELTRGQMAALIWRYAGFPAPNEPGCLAPGEWPCPGLYDAEVLFLWADWTDDYQDAEVFLGGSGLAPGQRLTIDFSTAEQGVASYGGCGNADLDVWAGTGTATMAVTDDESAVVTYTAGPADEADDLIGIEIMDCIDTEAEEATYEVLFTRLDTGSTTTAEFDVRFFGGAGAASAK